MNQYTLRQAFFEVLGRDKSYLHYYKSMIRAYENGLWSFDIRSVIKVRLIQIKCSYYFSSRGYKRQFCKVVIDFKAFKYQVEKYMQDYIFPLREVRAQKILARRAWIKKYGYISKGSQYCQEAMYECSKCLNQSACEVIRKYNKNDVPLKRMTKMLEILYGNLNSGHFSKQVKDEEY